MPKKKTRARERAAAQLSQLSIRGFDQEANRVRLRGERLSGLGREASRHLIDHEEAIRLDRIAAGEQAFDRRLFVTAGVLTTVVFVVVLKLILVSGQLPTF